MREGPDPAIVQAILDRARPGGESLPPVEWVELLRASGRHPRGDPANFLGIVDEIVVQVRADLEREPARCAESTARGAACAIYAATEPVDDLGELEQRSIGAVRDLERRLREPGLTEKARMRLVADLLAIAPTSLYAMSRARVHAAPLIEQPPPRAKAARRVWVAAAETIGMGEGDLTLTERGVDVALTLGIGAEAARDPLAFARTAWALLRLERFTEAIALLTRARRGPRASGPLAAWRDGLEAYALHLAGSQADAVEAGRRAAMGTGPGVQLGRAFAARALIAQGRSPAARRLLDGPAPRSLSGSAIRLVKAELDLAEGRPAAALRGCESVSEDLRRAGVRNPAGWPWARTAIEAALQLGHRDEALRLLEGLERRSARWPTPLVRAELLRCHAALAEMPEARTALLRQAAEVLAGGEAHAEAARVARLAGIAPPADGDPPAGEGLLAALTPRGREVADLVAAGLRDREIAERLGLSVRTVHRHVAGALRATGARNRAALARLVAENGGSPVSAR